MTVRAALEQGQQLLEDAGVAAPRLTAEILLIHAVSLGSSLDRACDRAWLYAHANDELHELWWIHYGRYLHERMQGKPTQYITGRQEFYGRDFRVTPDVLIPRPETEHLIETALAHANAVETALAHANAVETALAHANAVETALARANAVDAPRVPLSPAVRILDIGTGSGAIAITLALETKARVMATDISPAALGIAKENARRLGADVSLAACDLGSAFADETFNIVVSNPPYVPARDRHNIQREVREFEPAVALYGGEDGLDMYRRLIPEAGRLLKSGGWLIMELGYAGLDPVRGMLAGWNDVDVVCDLAGLPRVIVARKPGVSKS